MTGDACHHFSLSLVPGEGVGPSSCRIVARVPTGDGSSLGCVWGAPVMAVTLNKCCPDSSLLFLHTEEDEAGGS